MKKPKRRGRDWRPGLAALLVLVLAVEGFLMAGLMLRPGSNFLAAVIQSEVIALTNTERAQLSIGPLRENAELDAAAQAKADDMAAKGYFAHVGPDGKLPWYWIGQAGYDYRYAGENLAMRFSDSRDVVQAWMASPTHRANIAKPHYQEIGVGVASGVYEGEPVTFVVQYFGSPALAAAPSAPAKAVSAAPVPAASAQTKAAAPEVAGAEVSVSEPDGAESVSLVQSIGRRFMALCALVLRSLPASVAETGGGGPVIIGADGWSTER